MNNQNERSGMYFIGDLGDAMRRNPVSTALIGMGLLWLFTGDKASAGASRLARKAGLEDLPDSAADVIDRGRSAVRDSLGRVGERLQDVTGSATSAASDMARAVRDRSADVVDRASEFGRSIPETGAEIFEDARMRLSDLFNEQPLLLGAIGVAIGAGIAASLPSTEMEAELFGDTSDELKAQARDFTRRQAGRAGDMARDVASAAAEEARRQGLTPEGAMAAARELGEKAKRVAEAAEDSVRIE